MSESLLDEEDDLDLFLELIFQNILAKLKRKDIKLLRVYLYLGSVDSLRLEGVRCFSVFLDRDRDLERRLCLLLRTLSLDFDLLLLLDFVILLLFNIFHTLLEANNR